jgi:hypothetical protein
MQARRAARSTGFAGFLLDRLGEDHPGLGLHAAASFRGPHAQLGVDVLRQPADVERGMADNLGNVAIVDNRS